MKIEPTKLFIVVRRNEIIWQLHSEGYSTGDISSMVNLDRTWISRIIKLMPKGWTIKDISKYTTE
jgi:hypothetical protein